MTVPVLLLLSFGNPRGAVIRVRPAPKDKYGNPQGEDSRLTIKQCLLAPKVQAPDTPRPSERDDPGYMLYTKPTADIRHGDQIEAADGTWHVGSVARWHAGLEIALTWAADRPLEVGS